MLCESKLCTGCNACAAVCPVNAIEMKADIKGFLHPFIEKEKCIDCGKCERVCAGLDYGVKDENEQFYAARALDDDVRKKCSSGGVFALLASAFIDAGGIVYGACLSSELIVKHVRIEKKEDLESIYGSKYVQSDMDGIYALIEKDLKAGRQVLFSGTPCQVEGVRRFCMEKGKCGDWLYCCDIVCHGVPSPELWKKYLEMLKEEHGQEVARVRFRGKDEGWHERTKVRYNLKESKDNFSDNRFTELFIDNYSIRSSCNSCNFSTTKRNADITLGDFWGIEKSSCKALDDNYGTSLVIVHSDKGKELLKLIENNCVIERCSGQEAVTEQNALREPFSAPKDITEFWRDYFAKGMSYVCDNYAKKNIERSREKQSKYKNTKYWIMMPDGNGSLGDEAMLRGLLDILKYDNVTLLNPDYNRSWKGKLPDLFDMYEEVFVRDGKAPVAFTPNETLLIMGADVIDGTCGLDESLMRLEIAAQAIDAGEEVHVFCSFRTGVDERILNKIKELETSKMHWHLRDEISIANFERQIEIKADYFTDFAFFCEKKQTKYTVAIKEKIGTLKKDKYTVIGLNFSQQSFNSFYEENTADNWNAYIQSVVQCIFRNVEKPYVMLISHDIRKWEGHLSDGEFQRIAAKCIPEKSCFLLHEDTSYSEMLDILPCLDFLVSGRMHLSVAAFRAGIIPIVFTGASKQKNLFSMSEKVEGMFNSRIGRNDLVAKSIDELDYAVKLVVSDKEMLVDRLCKMNSENNGVEEEEKEKIRKVLNVNVENSIFRRWRSAVAQGEALYEKEQVSELATGYLKKTADVERLREECKAIFEQKEKEINQKNNEIGQKERKIEQLSEKIAEHERIIIELENKQKEYLELTNNQKGHIEQLMQSERDLQAELMVIKSARLYRLMSVIWKIEGKIIPLGSRRRFVLSILFRFIRHPLRMIRKISVTNIKKVCKILVKKESSVLAEDFVVNEVSDDTFCENMQLLIEERVKTIADISKCEKIHFERVEKPLVSIVIPVYNQFSFTYHCLKAISENTQSVSYEVIIADDCSDDLTVDIGRVAENIIIAKTESNLRFLKNCNNAAQYARGKYILFLNNDTEVQEGWLEPLVNLIERDKTIGMVGSKLVYADGRLQEAGGICWRDGSAWNYGNRQDASASEYNYVKDVDYISGASLMIRRSLWEEIGGFDERFIPAYCEDSDLAFEVRKHGYRVVYQPKSVVMHFEGISNGTDVTCGVKKYQVENSRRLQEKWAYEFAKQYQNAVNIFRARERSKDKKIVLFIDHYVPHFDEDAGSKTIYQYLQMFVKKGYVVKFIGDNFYRHEPYTTVLQQLGIEVLYGPYYAQHVLEWIRENKEQIDYVFLNRPHISAKYIDVIRKKTDIKTIYYGHDLHFLRNQREYELTGNIEKKKESEEWKEKELKLMRSADISYYPSYIEEEEIHRIDPSIPVKAITAYVYDSFKEDINYDFASREGILFVGGFRHDPNADAVLWFVKEIWPLIRKEQKINFYIVGSHATEEIQTLDGKNGIVVKGFVSDEELERLYAQCKMVVVPLRYGAGVKGKVVEAIYNGMPVVTTSVGAEGIKDIESATVIEDSPEKFAIQVANLYKDNERLKTLAEATQVLIKEQFSTEAVWNIIKDDFN